MAGPVHSRLDKVARITQITTGISVIVGIFVALYGLYDTKRQADLSLQAMRMTQLAELQKMIKANRAVADDQVKPFLALLPEDQSPGRTAQSGSKCLGQDGLLLPAQTVLENHGHNGKQMYKDTCFKHFRKAGRHYDELGAMVRLGYLDFDFLYTLLAFPDDFWDKTRDYRYAVQSNWSGRDQPLVDFWINFSWLRDAYHRARRAQR